MAQSGFSEFLEGLTQGADPWLKALIAGQQQEKQLKARGEQQIQLQREKIILEDAMREKANVKAPEQIRTMIEALTGGNVSRHTRAGQQPQQQSILEEPEPQTQIQTRQPQAPQARLPQPSTMPVEEAQIVEETVTGQPPLQRQAQGQGQQVQQATAAQPKYTLLNPIPQVSMTRSGKGEISSTVSSMDPKTLANNNLVDLIERQGAKLPEAKAFLLENGMIPDQAIVNSYGRQHFMQTMTGVKKALDVQEPLLPEGNKMLIAASIAGSLVGYEYAPTEIINALLQHKVQMTPEIQQRVYAQFGTVDPEPWQVQQEIVNERYDRANMEIDVAFAKQQNEQVAKAQPLPPRQQWLAAPPLGDKTKQQAQRGALPAPAVPPPIAQAQQPTTGAAPLSGMGAEAELKYRSERATRQAEFDAPKRMTPAQATETLKTINVSRDIAGIAKVFDADLIGPLKGRGDWLKAASGKLGVKEANLRGQIQLAANSLIRLYAGLTQSMGEAERQALVTPNPNEAPEQFISKYNNLVRQVYQAAIDNEKTLTAQLGGPQGIPPNLIEIKNQLKDVYRESNRAAAYFLLRDSDSAKRIGRHPTTGAPVYKLKTGETIVVKDDLLE